MKLDPTTARDLMASIFSVAWLAYDWPSLGLAMPPSIEWQGRGGDSEPDSSLPYARWAATHSAMPQASLADADGDVKFNSQGIITVQCKAPLSSGQGFEVAERMAIIARNAYRSKELPDCIWFRNARIQEVGSDAGWFLFNAFIEFDYDEVG